uniref:CSON003053 protein n=1 Tax=Culicoides sonorensis TaxID=179676 RepID=A0A336MQ70_CULSO
MRSKSEPSKIKDTKVTAIDPNEKIDVYVSIPTDGAFGWLIVVASFISNILVDGLMFNFGSFITPMTTYFATDTATVSMLLSIQSGIYFIIGPIISALINQCGFRSTGVIGAIFCCIGLFASSYAESVSILMLTFGVLRHYFEKYRALANGITCSGSGAGTFLIGQLLPFLLKRYNNDWQFILRIFSGMYLITFPIVALYKPLKPKKFRVLDRKVQLDESDSETSQITINFAKSRVPTLSNIISIYSISNDMSFDSRQLNANDNSEMLNKTNKCFQILCPCIYKRSLSVATRTKQLFSRPVYRDDAFYTHSLGLLPEYEDKRSMIKSDSVSVKSLMKQNLDDDTLSYHLTVSRVPSIEEIDKEPTCCNQFIGTIHRTLLILFDPKFFKIFSFYLLALSSLIGMLGLYLPAMFLIGNKFKINHFDITDNLFTDRVKQKIEFVDHVKHLTMAIGLSNMMGRFASGLLTFCPFLNTTIISGIGTGLSGIACLLIGFTDDSALIELIILCTVFGFCIGFAASLRAVMYVENFGLENLTNAYGLFSLAIGIGALIGPSFAGYLKDLTNTYTIPFIFGGTTLIISSIILIVTPFTNKFKCITN